MKRAKTALGWRTMNKNIDAREVRDMLDNYSSDEMSLDTVTADAVKIGYWTALANGIYYTAKDAREFAEADAILVAKLGDPKMSAAMLGATATKAVKPLKEAETKARTNAEKLQNLWTVLCDIE